jgi:cobalt-zinc-cadmium efflux system outer membrane protein
MEIFARNTLALGFVSLLVLALSLPAQATADRLVDDVFPDATVLDRGALVRAVLERNPSVEAARSAWRAASAMPAEKRALDDPMLSYSLAPRSIDVGDMRYGQVIEFGQRLPFPGKRGLRAAVAEAEARAAGGDYETTRRDVALMACLLFAEYYEAHRAVEVNERHGRLLEETLESARAGYVAGRVPQHVLLRTELELAHVLHDAAEVHSAADVARASLNALLHRPPSSPLPPPPRELVQANPAAPTREAGDDGKDALARRTDVAAARARVEAADAGVRLARREYFPDLTVGAEYNSMWDDEEHRLMVGVQVEIPLPFGRRKAALSAAEAEAASRRAELAGTERSAAAEIESARRRLREAEHIAMLYRDHLMPAARDVVVSVRTGFTAATADFRDVIDAEHEQRDIELQYETSIVGLARRHAELERSLGLIPGVEP